MESSLLKPLFMGHSDFEEKTCSKTVLSDIFIEQKHILQVFPFVDFV